jgi:hypothetical protein
VLRKKRKIGTMEHWNNWEKEEIGTLEHWKDGIMGFCFPNIPLTNIPIFQLEHDAP